MIAIKNSIEKITSGLRHSVGVDGDVGEPIITIESDDPTSFWHVLNELAKLGYRVVGYALIQPNREAGHGGIGNVVMQYTELRDEN